MDIRAHIALARLISVAMFWVPSSQAVECCTYAFEMESSCRGVDADWLWGVSNTPYGHSHLALASSSSQVETGDTGPGKQRAHFSFVQRDAAQRNQIF